MGHFKNIGHSKKKGANNLPDHLNDPNGINNYFTASVSQLITPPPDYTIDFYCSHLFDPTNNFSFNTVTDVEVENYIKNIKTNAMGTDGITLKMLQICIPFLTPVSHLHCK